MSDHANTDSRDDELTVSITPDVMKCLTSGGFFEELDNRLSPVNTSAERQRCAGTYQVSESILRSQGFDDLAIADIFEVLAAQGGFCDCEVLYNVVETSRLKAGYWRARGEHDARISHGNSK